MLGTKVLHKLELEQSYKKIVSEQSAEMTVKTDDFMIVEFGRSKEQKKRLLN